LALLACTTQTIVFPDSGLGAPTDADGDGHDTPQDCDDGDPAVHPDADEVCDEQDNDCDGLVDGQDPGLVDGGAWYLDSDGDGYGDSDTVEVRCFGGEDWVRDGGDCDESDPDINPGENERCNEVDDNCNGLVEGQDPTLEDGTTWCWDGDEDGYGDPEVSEYRCSAPMGYVEDCSDCDDDDPDIHDCGDELLRPA